MTRAVRGNHVAHLRIVILQDVAVIIGDLANESRHDTHPIVGEGGEGGGVLQQRDLAGAERDGQVGGRLEVTPKRRA